MPIIINFLAFYYVVTTYGNINYKDTMYSAIMFLSIIYLINSKYIKTYF